MTPPKGENLLLFHTGDDSASDVVRKYLSFLQFHLRSDPKIESRKWRKQIADLECLQILVDILDSSGDAIVQLHFAHHLSESHFVPIIKVDALFGEE